MDKAKGDFLMYQDYLDSILAAQRMPEVPLGASQAQYGRYRDLLDIAAEDRANEQVLDFSY